MRKVLTVLFSAFAALMLPLFAAAAATQVWVGDNMTVVLTDEPCKQKVLAFLEPRVHSQYRRAGVFLADKRYLEACYIPLPAGMTPEPSYFFVDEEGDAGAMPRELFKSPDRKTPVLPVGIAF